MTPIIGHIHQGRESLDIGSIGGIGADVGELGAATLRMKVQWYVCLIVYIGL